MLKKEEFIYLEARSPQDLGKTLDVLAEKNNTHQHLASLDIYGQGILVRQFEMPRMEDRELKNALKLEAVELLSLPPEEIDFDYQVLQRGVNIKGVFTAIPDKVLSQYIAFLNKAKLVPLKISALILREISTFYKKNLQKIKEKNCCLIVNPKDQVINFAVFNKGSLELLREIYFGSFEEAAHEVVETIKYYLGKNPGKQLDEIYMITRSIDSGKLAKTLEHECGAKIFREESSGKDALQPDLSDSDLFNINLIKKDSVSLGARKAILYGMTAIILALVFITCAQMYQLNAIHAKISQIKNSFNPDDYKYAKDLEAQKELIKNAK